MKTLSLLIILVLGFNSSIYSQTLKTFSGTYDDGKFQNGKATYTYYEDPQTKEYVRDGKFTYSFIGKKIGVTDYTGLTETINGNFKKGLRDGLWTYTINLTDNYMEQGLNSMEVKNPYSTGTITLTSNYSNGYPNGTFTYKLSIKKRSKYLVQGLWRWDNYGPIQNKNVAMTFKNGMLVGNVDITDELKNLKLTGVIDNDGMMTGKWNRIDEGNTMEMTFQNGVLIEYVGRNKNTGEINSKGGDANGIELVKQFASSNKKDELDFKVDTICLLSNSNEYVTQYLRRLFSDDYFLYSKIKGDLVYDKEVHDDLEYSRGIKEIRGAYNIQITRCPKLTPDTYYGDFYNKAEKLMQEENYYEAVRELKNNIVLDGFCKREQEMVKQKLAICEQKINDKQNAKKAKKEFAENFQNAEFDSMDKFVSIFWENFKPKVNSYQSSGYDYPPCHPKSENVKNGCGHCIHNSEQGIDYFPNNDEWNLAQSQRSYLLILDEELRNFRGGKIDQNTFTNDISIPKQKYQTYKSLYLNKISLQKNNSKIEELNNSNKKKTLNKKYKQVYEEFLSTINDTKQDINARENKIKDLLIISDKVIALYSQDTTDIENKLKDSKTTDDIKKILGL